MNSKFIWSQTNLNPVELERPDYRYWFSDLWINFKSSVGNKYFPHWMFRGNADVPWGQTNQPPNRVKIPVSFLANVWADVWKSDWWDIVFTQDSTYMIQIVWELAYPLAHDNNTIKNVLLLLERDIDWNIIPFWTSKRSSTNSDSISHIEIVSLEKWNRLSFKLGHTFYWETADWHISASIVKLS